MKAENILIQIWEKKHNFLWLILQKLDFQNFGLYFVKEKKILNLKFSKIFLYNPLNSCFLIVLNTKNDIYTRVWQS